MAKKKQPKRKKKIVKTKQSIYQKNYTQYREYADGESRACRTGQKKTHCTEIERMRKRAVNIESAREKVYWLVEQNFEKQDFHVVLKYKTVDGELQRSDEQVKTDIAKFLRKLRADYKKHGNELKYILIFERGEATGKQKLHVHMIVSSVSRPIDPEQRRTWSICNDITPDLVREHWRLVQQRDGCKAVGEAYIKPLISSYYKIGGYLSKEFSEILDNMDYLDNGIRKRYSRSRNLELPKVYYEDIDTGESILQADYEGMMLDADTYKWRVDGRGNITESARFKDCQVQE